MFRQGDKERSLHLPISPLADRTRKGVTQMQVCLLSEAARPLPAGSWDNLMYLYMLAQVQHTKPVSYGRWRAAGC